MMFAIRGMVMLSVGCMMMVVSSVRWMVVMLAIISL